MQLFNRYVSTRSLTVFGGELLLIFGSVALAASLLFQLVGSRLIDFFPLTPQA